MRSMVPRIRTVSCAEAGKARQIEAKLKAASMRVIPYIYDLPDFRRVLSATPSISKYSSMKKPWKPRGPHRAAAEKEPLLDLDPGILDHLAPARFLAAHIAVEFLRRTRHHHQALVHAEPPEGLGFHRFGG